MYLTSFKCGGVIFDIYDSEEVSSQETDHNYFITPKRMFKAEAWTIRNKRKVQSRLDMAHLINEDIIGTYVRHT